MFDPRVRSLTPFVPHPLAAMQRALPPGTMDATLYENITKRYARLADPVIERMLYAVDGLQVTGAFVHPRAITPGKHPILVFNRGGSGDYGMLVLPVILRYGVPFAERGYLVFGSNYRGNDGGEGADGFGGGDVQDVLTLLDIARRHPGWDGKNIYMLGGSRGGMMTFLAIKHGAKLTAAATFGAITDLAAEDGDWPTLAARFHARLPDPKPALEEMIAARSAVQWPQELTRVPLLLMHGAADGTVSANQARALDAALAPIHPDMKTVLYPGGNHSLSTHIHELIGDSLGWFAAHRR